MAAAIVPAVGCAGGSAGAARLRGWDLCASEAKKPSSARPSRCAPRDRSRLLQRTRLTSASPRAQAKHAAAAERGLQALKQLGELQVPPAPATNEAGHRGQQQQQPDLTEQVLCQAEAAWLDPPDEDRRALQVAGLQLPSPGSDQDIMEKALPGTRGLSLATEEKERFFGNLSGSKVQQELLRLATLLHSLMREFAVVKDSVGHLEDDRGSHQIRMERLDTQCFGRLEEIVQDFEERLEVNDTSAADCTQKATEVIQRCDEVCEKSEEIQARFELTEARVAELEDLPQEVESFCTGTSEKLEELKLQADDFATQLSANAEASRAEFERLEAKSRAEFERLEAKVAEEAVARAALEERLRGEILDSAEVTSRNIVRQALDELKQGALKDLQDASEATARDSSQGLQETARESRQGLQEIAKKLEEERAARHAQARTLLSQAAEAADKVEKKLVAQLNAFSLPESDLFVSQDVLNQRLESLEAGLVQRLAEREDVLNQRLEGLEAGLVQRLAAVQDHDVLNQRLEGLEAGLVQRLAAMQDDLDRRLAGLQASLTLQHPSSEKVPAARPETASTRDDGDYIGAADFRSLEPGRYRPPSAPARVAVPEPRARPASSVCTSPTPSEEYRDTLVKNEAQVATALIEARLQMHEEEPGRSSDEPAAAAAAADETAIALAAEPQPISAEAAAQPVGKTSPLLQPAATKAAEASPVIRPDLPLLALASLARAAQPVGDKAPENPSSEELASVVQPVGDQDPPPPKEVAASSAWPPAPPPSPEGSPYPLPPPSREAAEVLRHRKSVEVALQNFAAAVEEQRLAAEKEESEESNAQEQSRHTGRATLWGAPSPTELKTQETPSPSSSVAIHMPRLVLGDSSLTDEESRVQSGIQAQVAPGQEADPSMQQQRHQQQQQQQKPSAGSGSADASAAPVVSDGYDEAYEIPEAAWEVFSEGDIVLDGDAEGTARGQRAEAGEPATDLTEDDDMESWGKDLEQAFLQAERKNQKSAPFAGEESSEECDSHVSFGSQSAAASQSGGRSGGSQQRVVAHGTREDELEDVEPEITAEADPDHFLPLEEGGEQLPAFGASGYSGSAIGIGAAAAPALPSFGPPSAGQQRPWSPGRVYAGSRMRVSEEPEDNQEDDGILEAGDSELLLAAEDDRG